jgi:hypothetical protein
MPGRIYKRFYDHSPLMKNKDIKVLIVGKEDGKKAN